MAPSTGKKAFAIIGLALMAVFGMNLFRGPGTRSEEPNKLRLTGPLLPNSSLTTLIPMLPGPVEPFTLEPAPEITVTYPSDEVIETYYQEVCHELRDHDDARQCHLGLISLTKKFVTAVEYEVQHSTAEVTEADRILQKEWYLVSCNDFTYSRNLYQFSRGGVPCLDAIVNLATHFKVDEDKSIARFAEKLKSVNRDAARRESLIGQRIA